MVNINVEVDEERHRTLKSMAAKEGIHLHQKINQILQEYLVSYQAKTYKEDIRQGET